MFVRMAVVLALLAAWTNLATAFDGHTVTEGPLVLSIGELSNVTQVNQPYDVTAALENTGSGPLEVDVRIDDLVDEWRVVGESTQHVKIEPQAKSTGDLPDRRLAGRAVRVVSCPCLRIVPGRQAR